MLPDSTKWLVAAILTTAFLIYSIRLYSVLPSPGAHFDPRADRGKMVWQENNCTACHQLYGLGGYLGPDLTNEYSRRDTAFIRQFIRLGTPVMPGYDLTGQEFSDLLRFLAHVDTTGVSDPRSFTIRHNGTIVQR